MAPIEVPESGNIVVGNRLGNGKEKGAAREKSQSMKGKGWHAPEWVEEEEWGLQGNSRPPPPPMKGGKGKSLHNAYYEDKNWGHGGQSWQDGYNDNVWEEWQPDGMQFGMKGKSNGGSSGIRNLKSIVQTIMHEGDGKGKAKGYGNPAQFLTPTKKGTDDGSDYGKGGASTPSTTWSSPGSEKGQEWGRQWIPEQGHHDEWTRYGGGKSWKGDQKGGDKRENQELFQEWVQSKTAQKGGGDAGHGQGPGNLKLSHPQWDEWDEPDGRKADQGAVHSERPTTAQGWARKGAREAARGVPRWYFPASSMRREGHITGIGAPHQVSGTASFDWGGIHLGGRHYDQLLSCAQEKGATCRVVCIAVDPVEAELLAKGQQDGAHRGFCVVVAGDQKDRVRFSEIVSRIEWRIEKSESWDRLDFLLQEFAAQQGLRTKSSRTELMQCCVGDENGSGSGTESTPMQNGQPVHTAELEKYIQDRIALAFQQQSGSLSGHGVVPGHNAQPPQGQSLPQQVCCERNPKACMRGGQVLAGVQACTTNGSGGPGSVLQGGAQQWGQQWITPTPQLHAQGMSSVYTPTLHQGMVQQASFTTPTYPNQQSWQQSGSLDANGCQPQGYVQQLPLQGEQLCDSSMGGWEDGGHGATGYPNQMMNAIQGGSDTSAPIPGQGHHGGGQGVGDPGPGGQYGQAGTPPAPSAQQGQPATSGGGHGSHPAQIGACVAEVCWVVRVWWVMRCCVPTPGQGISSDVQYGGGALGKQADMPAQEQKTAASGDGGQHGNDAAKGADPVDQHGFPVPHHAIGAEGTGTVLQQPNLKGAYNVHGGGPSPGGDSARPNNNVGGAGTRYLQCICAQATDEKRPVLRVDISSDDTVGPQDASGAQEEEDVDMNPEVSSHLLKPAESTDAQRASWGGAKRQRILKPSGRQGAEPVHRSQSPPRGKVALEQSNSGNCGPLNRVHKGVLSGVYDSFDSSAPMPSCFESQGLLDDSDHSAGEQPVGMSQTQQQFVDNGDSCDSLFDGSVTESQVNCFMESCPPGGAAS